jgi:hypothetical protein
LRRVGQSAPSGAGVKKPPQVLAPAAVFLRRLFHNLDHDDLKKWNPTHALARLQPGFKLTLWTSSLR